MEQDKQRNLFRPNVSGRGLYGSTPTPYFACMPIYHHLIVSKDIDAYLQLIT